jgi:HEAT repeat protein
LEAFTHDLASADVEIRRNSAWNLMHFNKSGRAAVPALTKCLADPDAKVRQYAADALESIAGQTTPPAPQGPRANFE